MISNKVVALIIGGGAALTIGLLFTIYLISYPDNAFEKINSVNVKTLLIYSIDLLIILLAIAIYKFFRSPPASRMVRASWRIVFMIGMVSTPAPFGLFAMDKLEILTNGINTSITLKMATYSAAPIFLIMIIGSFALNGQYIKLRTIEQKMGIKL